MEWPADNPNQAEYLQRYTWGRSSPSNLYERLAAGSPIFLPDFGTMTPEQIRGVASGTGLDRMLAARSAGAHSLMGVPLVARGAILGVVVLFRLSGSRPFADSDLSLACDLVSRAAVSIDNARLYTRERATALALQRGLLPRNIPEVPGLEVAHRYVPAQTAAEVGGDWFDVIPLPPDRCALIVGDVTGHDIRAASLMGQLRTATRTLATLDLAPAEVLTRLDLDHRRPDRRGNRRHVRLRRARCRGRRLGHLPGGASAAGRAPPRRQFHVPGHAPRRAAGDGPRQHPSVSDRAFRGAQPQRPGPVHRRADRAPRRRPGHRHGRAGSALRTVCALPLREACDTLLDTLAPSPADDIAILMAQVP